MTALAMDRRIGWIDRTALSLGQALTSWGTRHATMRSAPVYSEQDARITAARDNAARILPQLPR